MWRFSNSNLSTLDVKPCSRCGMPLTSKAMKGHWSHCHIGCGFNNMELEVGNLPKDPHNFWAHKVMKHVDNYDPKLIMKHPYYGPLVSSIRALFPVSFNLRFNKGIELSLEWSLGLDWKQKWKQ